MTSNVTVEREFEQTLVSYDDEVELIEFLHKETLSDDPVVACAARGLKNILPPFVRWADEEKNRGIEPCKFLTAISTLTATLIGTAVKTSIDIEECHNQMTIAVAGLVSKVIKSALEGSNETQKGAAQ